MGALKCMVPCPAVTWGIHLKDPVTLSINANCLERTVTTYFNLFPRHTVYRESTLPTVLTEETTIHNVSLYLSFFFEVYPYLRRLETWIVLM